MTYFDTSLDLNSHPRKFRASRPPAPCFFISLGDDKPAPDWDRISEWLDTNVTDLWFVKVQQSKLGFYFRSRNDAMMFHMYFG